MPSSVPPPEPGCVDTAAQALEHAEMRALSAETTLRKLRNDIARLEATYCVEQDIHCAGQSELGALEHALDRLNHAVQHKFRLRYVRND